MGPSHVENVADLACRTALTYRGVAHITFPVDLQEEKVKEHSKRNVPGHTSRVLTCKGGLPREEDLTNAAAVLNEGQRIAILAGQGSLSATDELEEAAEKLGAPIIKPLL